MIATAPLMCGKWNIAASAMIIFVIIAQMTVIAQTALSITQLIRIIGAYSMQLEQKVKLNPIRN